MISYTNRRNTYGVLTNNTTAANLTLGDRLMNDADKYLINRFHLTEGTDTTQVTIAGTQAYNLPYNVNKLLDVYVAIGTIRYTLKPVSSRSDWDNLNYVQYRTNIPEYYYQYGSQINIFPVPSTSGYTITQNYKKRVKDLSQADYTTGTIAISNGSLNVIGTGTTFTQYMVGRYIQIGGASGDNQWYEIASFSSATSITITTPYQGITTASTTYTIGEVSPLDEQYQNLPIYYACMVYFSSRVKDADMHNMYAQMYNDGVKQMNEDLTSKTENVVIDDGIGGPRLTNPNYYVTL